jgi:hypothetical protein
MSDALADQVLPAVGIPQIEHAIGPLRQAILDHLLDTVGAGPQSVAQILAALPAGTTRGNLEASLHREYRAGRIIRTNPGCYILAPPKPPEPTSPLAADDPAAKVVAMAAGFAWPAADRGALTEDEWFEALERWRNDPSMCNAGKLGPPPGQDGSRVPFDIWRRWRDRVRKREERAREAEERAARQRQADTALVGELIEAAGGCVVRGRALDDVAPIRAALADGIPMDTITTAIRWKCDRRMYPPNEPASSWREERILKAIAELFCRRIVKNMVSAWGAAGNAPEKPAGAPREASCVQEPPAPEDSSAAIPGAPADITERAKSGAAA